LNELRTRNEELEK